MNKVSLLLLGSLLSSFISCGKQAESISTTDTSRFGSTPQSVPVLVPLNEASGVADSHAGDYLWVIEDSGNPAQLLYLKKDGSLIKPFPLAKAQNYDWEDLALANGDLYIADIGDNARQRTSCTVYQVPEPDNAASDSLTDYKPIRFKYPDMAHDAEALLVDPQTSDLFVITKNDASSLIFKLAYPYSYGEMNTMELVGSLPFNGVTGAAISKTGREILLKTYTKVYLFHRDGTQPIAATLLSGGTPRGSDHLRAGLFRVLYPQREGYEHRC